MNIFGFHWVGYTQGDIVSLTGIVILAFFFAVLLSGIVPTVPYEDDDDENSDRS